jgi:hypothetical protein
VVTERDHGLAPRSPEPDGYLRARADGRFTRVADGAEVLHEVPRAQVTELRHLIGLRDVARALLDAEAASGDDTPRIGELRATLNTLYDTYLRAYGPLNRFTLRRTGRVDPVTGEPVMARIQPVRGGFRDDPFAPLVHALEEFEPSGQRAAKSAIFRERVVAPRSSRLGADTAEDALAICLDARGEPSLPEIARLLGVTEDEARAQLGPLVFDEPGSGRLVPAAEYLSGNVRDKLRAAERAAADDPRFAVNVAELGKVIRVTWPLARSTRGSAPRGSAPPMSSGSCGRSSTTRACWRSTPAGRYGRCAATPAACSPPRRGAPAATPRPRSPRPSWSSAGSRSATPSRPWPGNAAS